MNFNNYFDFNKIYSPYTHSAPCNPGSVAPDNVLRGEKPKMKKGFWPCLSKGKVVYIEDHRGEEGYLNGNLSEITDLGPYPNGWNKNPPQPTEDELKQEKIAEIEAQLSEIDMQSVRPLRAILDGSATNFDKNKLKELENQAETLRQALSELN